MSNQSATPDVPLEWSPLFAAMKEASDKWIPTTEAMHEAMLGTVPPAAISGSAFLVGEPNHHNDQGSAVYACFKLTAGKFYAKYLTRAQFRDETA